MRLELPEQFDNESTTVWVYLSERNLRALLAKLEGHPPNSFCTLTYATKNGALLVVSAEPDEIHYANPERESPVPGRVHIETESAIRTEKK